MPRTNGRAMTYSPATRLMQRLFAAHQESARTGVPVDDVLGALEVREAAERRLRALGREQAAEAGPSRRDLFRYGAAGGAAVLGLGALSRATPARAATAPRIAIVGAGLAGVRCAHMLWTGSSSKGPVASTVYEADTTHIGGRCWSLRGYFDNGLVGEHGGAFINSNQKSALNLARTLGLTTEITNGGDLPTGNQIYWFDGKPYTYAQANADWSAIGFPAFSAAGKAAPWPQAYNSFTAAGQKLDQQTVPEWLDSTGIGQTTLFGRLMLANSVSEYGGDPSLQSALNLVYLLYKNSQNQLQPMTGYDEKYHIVGGNDQLVSGMLAQLPAGTVQQGHQLVALARNSDGSYTLTFQQPGRTSTTTVVADHVVLALPFTALQKVDFSQAGLSAFKTSVVNAGVLGQNAKIHVEVSHKTWPALGDSGSAYTDWNAFCVAWDDSVPTGPNGAPSVLLAFPGGSTAQHTLTGAPHGPAPAADVNWFLNQIEPIYPGTTAAYTGKAYEDHWSVDPWHYGAYSYNKPGYYTSMFGYEHVQEGNIHFAGEHTSIQDQAFLEGGITSGEAAATEILAQI
ncbi:flavin monoamine oxidase family protein [Streptacidiphilus jiangxiensis]|uniref:Monoamine oxidase n=1 Tax=Streptacidiphilus jiangxiensis TaxID=235985 RepID=A0A1H8BPY9_STRJI|nr:NAD(P)/FAD-dependent oxidoreductase [Streptacidiphilus jiangxiensis]SEM16331.1 monoamine oxidase [Streptacidiphilus jiangxiensis]SEM84836.1 monoamine oxidase [Streptacidiphilus jiangxiensis]